MGFSTTSKSLCVLLLVSLAGGQVQDGLLTNRDFETAPSGGFYHDGIGTTIPNWKTSGTVELVESGQKEKKKKKKKANEKEEAVHLGDTGHQKQLTEKNINMDANSAGEEKNKKKKNKQLNEADTTVDEPVANKKGTPQEKTKGKPAQVRTFPNGLVIEEVAMGKPDGKKASPGKKVSVYYIGKLNKNGAIFDSNVGGAPFKFRLGVGEVIKGWDVGVNGMRVRGKRRLTIPPAMGYGAKGAGKQIPPNSWLVFDVELVAVN